jgi:nicotinamidase-related amidase
VQVFPCHQQRGALGHLDQPGNDRIEGRIALLLRRQRKARIAVFGARHGHQVGE